MTRLPCQVQGFFYGTKGEIPANPAAFSQIGTAMPRCKRFSARPAPTLKNVSPAIL
jgi:hypothetical protein